MDQSRENLKLKKYLAEKGLNWGNFFRFLFSNYATFIIIFSNVAVFFIPGLHIKTDAISLLWIYLCQSILIGILHIFKLNFYRFAPSNSPNDTIKSTLGISIFFFFHYGFFHFVYAFFIPPAQVNWMLVGEGILIFSVMLLINTIQHYPRENSERYSAGDFMFLPYVRIIPIHIAIILGSFFSAISGNFAPVFITLAVLKTSMELGLEFAQSKGVSLADMNQFYENESSKN